MTQGLDLRTVLEALAASRGVDFSDYRPEHIERALRVRMEERGIDSVREYHDLVLTDPLEREGLVSALVVPVTGLFRDASVFEALRGMLGGRLVYDRLRAWVIGTASGEEAWSLAAVLADAWPSPAGFEVLGTDVDSTSLTKARRGEYARDSLAAVPNRYRAHFVDTGTRVVVAPHLRQHVTFALHDVVGATLAPPEALVASFRLVLFRNVLIYFERRLQEKALERVCATLESGGHLVLGQVESLPPSIAHRFDPVPALDHRLRIFRRRSGASDVRS